MAAVQKVWGFLKALFWLERLDRLAQEKRWNLVMLVGTLVFIG